MFTWLCVTGNRFGLAVSCYRRVRRVYFASDTWVCLCWDKHAGIYTCNNYGCLPDGCVASFCKLLWPSGEQLVFASKMHFFCIFVTHACTDVGTGRSNLRPHWRVKIIPNRYLVTLTNVCQSFLFWGRVLFNYLVWIGNKQKCCPSHIFLRKKYLKMYYNFPWTCGWNSTLADETLIGRWLPPAALASYLYYLLAGQTATCSAMSSEICADCPRHFKLLSCVTSNF